GARAGIILRFFAECLLASMVVSLGTAFLILVAAWWTSSEAWGAPTASEQMEQVETAARNTSPMDGPVTEGRLMFRTESEPEMQPALVLETDVTIRVTGPLARAVVRQRFKNPTEAWAEGIYLFPLPESAAVDHMRMRIGERVIEGEIQQRAQAKKTYEAAKKAGKRTSLVEQERPNMFTTSVANIPPSGEIVVEIEYQERPEWKDGAFSLRFPMVVGPRYIPPEKLKVTEEIDLSGQGWLISSPPEDADRLTAPLHESRESDRINPVALTVILETGFPLAKITSHHHRIIQSKPTAETWSLSLAEGEVPADRDFELTWTPVAGSAPRAALFSHVQEGMNSALMMVMPPRGDGVQSRSMPREVVYVIDVSGSMGGASIRQAKAALTMALDRLKPHDRFNVIAFNHKTKALHDRAVSATSEAVEDARNWVDNLDADGGTEMLSALIRSLPEDQQEDGWVRQVVFMTDGAVGNEKQLFQAIHRLLGERRLFTVGIGSAPNSHFMRTAARFGRGTFTHIGSPDQVLTRMESLFKKIESPVLSGIQVTFLDENDHAVNGVETVPGNIPDLYLGEPLAVAFQTTTMPAKAKVSGRFGRIIWESTLNLDGAVSRPGVGIYWARQKIEALMDGHVTGLNAQDIEAQVTQLALTHHLVSKYTSLVAVDKTPIRPDEALLRSQRMKTNLPHGWKGEGLRMPKTATPAQLYLMIGSLLLGIGGVMRRRQLGVGSV
ncbi:MAG: marine proteobacterial sortase target protein, partial [Magnetococcales bacterium]|nr:marine proteobacterial sortase target protein [Magnetococcales bacterium]